MQNDPARAYSRKLDSSLKADRKQMQNDVKLLLLGTGESGKSTIAKQMKIIHLKGFSQSEKSAYKAVIHNNILSSMQTITEQCLTRFGDQLPANIKEVATRFTHFMEENEGVLISPSIAEDLKTLWASEWIQKTHEKAGAEFYVLENISHYIANVDRIASDGYTPDEQDILRARATTTGVYETEFEVNNAHFRMVDVGGQRTERKKWIHCFEGVTAILFCVGLSEYDQKLIEDETTGRSEESLQLFGEICNSRWFDETAIILFLNKDDLFREKLLRTPITVGYPGYTGDNNYAEASQYIKQQYISKCNNPNKSIYPHFTTATSTENIKVVFAAVRDIVLQAALARHGIYV
jgi:guanine nucleotide-binding protein G(i) subunit alpha